FPVEMSPFGYDETVANEYFPISAPKPGLGEGSFSSSQGLNLFSTPGLNFKFKWRGNVESLGKTSSVSDSLRDAKSPPTPLCQGGRNLITDSIE
mgnify:CR=1